MADRNVYGRDSLGAIACPPVSVASVGAFLTSSMKTRSTDLKGVFGGVRMSLRAVGFGVIAVRPSCIDQGSNGFQMCGVDAVSVSTPLLDVVELQPLLNGSYQEGPGKTMGQRTFPFPVGQRVTVFTDGCPEPTTRFVDGDLVLQSFGQICDEVHI